MRLRVLAVAATLIAVVSSGSSRAGQQPSRQSAASGSYSSSATTPRIGPDGHPDLEGVWLNNSATPLERPKALEGRSTLTDEEVADLRRRAGRLVKGTTGD